MNNGKMNDYPSIVFDNKKRWSFTKYFWQWLVDLCLILVAFDIMGREGFGSDTLIHLYQPATSIITWARAGRFLAFLMNYALLMLGFSATDHYLICYIIFILLYSFSLLFIQLALLNERFGFVGEGDVQPTPEHASLSSNSFQLGLGCFLPACLMLINVFAMEYFMFTECFMVFPFAYFFASLGIWQFIRKRRGFGICLILIGCLYYQIAGIVAVLIIATWFIMEDHFRFSIRLVLKEISVCAGMMLFDILDMAVVNGLSSAGLIASTDKTVSMISINEMIANLHGSWRSLFRDSFTLEPLHWMNGMAWMLPCLIIVFLLWKQGEYSGIITLVLMELMYGIMISIFPVAGGAWTPRVVFPFYTGIALNWYCACILSLEYKGYQHLLDLLFVGAGTFLAVQLVLCNLIGVDHYVSNTLDCEYTDMVLDRIEQYEQETGIMVDKISMGIDTDCQRYYGAIKFRYEQINERTMAVVPYSLMHKVAGERGRTFQNMGQIPEDVFNRYFEGRNWDTLNVDEQVVILGDTAYWCIF